MTGEEILNYARGHDWAWCKYQGTPDDCHGRICRCQFSNWMYSLDATAYDFWRWVCLQVEEEGNNFKHPDKLKVSLLEWCLQDDGLGAIWKRVQEEEAKARMAQVHATALAVGMSGQLARDIVEKAKAKKHEARLAKRRSRYHQKKLIRELLDKPMQLSSSRVEMDGDFHPEDIIRQHNEVIKETERRMNE